MRKPRHPLLNWFSWNQHKRRLGAKSITQQVSDVDYETLKNHCIDTGEAVMTYGSKKDIQAHINELYKEFSGHSELCYYHAKLIVLIRRGVEVNKHFADFQQLWLVEKDFLLAHLSTRWLISAADTFIDHSSDKLLKATLMNAVMLVNTIKLTESERYLQQTEDTPINEQRKHSLQHERLALFDGVSGFAVGTDDTLRNMRWRLDKICAEHELGALVITVFERVQTEGNVYSRFRQLHTRDKTAWWGK